jgi:DNA-binding MarR family transcriptional regulator
MKTSARRRVPELPPPEPGFHEFPDKLGGAPHSKLSLRMWLRLLSCATVVEKRVRARLEEEFGTTLPRFDVLAAIARHPNGPTMSQLSRSMMVSNGNVTAVVNRLVQDGWIVRSVEGRDRRVATVRFTRKGRTAFAKMAEAHEKWIDTMFSEIPAPELESLMEALAAVRRSIEHSGV